MLIGHWSLSHEGARAIGPDDDGETLSFGEDGRMVMRTPYGDREADFEFDEATRTVRILEGGSEMARIELSELSPERMVGQFGPKLRTYVRVDAPTATPAPPAGAAAAPTISYWMLSASGEDCTVEVRLNGFVVLRGEAGDSFAGGMPVNDLLVGEGNLLELVVRDRGERARAQAGVEVQQTGEVVELPGFDGLSLEGAGADDTQSSRFDAPIETFAAVTRSSKRPTLEAARAWARALADELRRGDHAAVEQRLATQARMKAEAFGVAPEMVLGELRSMIEVLMGIGLDLEDGELELHEQCEGRLVQLTRPDAAALFQQRDDDGELEIRVHLADLGEGLVWIRS